MTNSRVTLERAHAINTKRVVTARERLLAWNDRQKRFLARAVERTESKRPWFVLMTEQHCEKIVHNLLKEASIEVWLPVSLEKTKRRFGAAGKSREVPVWAGYIFVRVAPVAESWAGLAAIKHVKTILTDGNRPIGMTDAEVKYLKDLVLSGKIKQKADDGKFLYEIGERVRVSEGPFASFPGVVECCDSEDKEDARVCVDVVIFGRATPVWLALDQIEKFK